MIIDIVMPKMGESITEGTILEWKKEIGEFVEMDEILLEIGTDKVDSEIPSPAAGKIIEILGKPNDVAHGIVYLCGDDASWVTGQVLSINGGFSMI